MSSPVILGGGELVIAVDFRGNVVSVTPKDGVVQWRARLSSSGIKGVAASPAVGRDGSLYIPDYDNNLHAFAGNGG
jgi:outer membrane protein assembly factor BamB